jgi:hypothetical protein
MSRHGGVWPVAVPQFRSLDQLSGDVAARPSAFWAAWAEADERNAEFDRLARDNEMLVRQNEALLCRIQELTAEDDAKAETIGDLNARVLRMAGELAEARRQRDWEFAP